MNKCIICEDNEKNIILLQNDKFLCQTCLYEIRKRQTYKLCAICNDFIFVTTPYIKLLNKYVCWDCKNKLEAKNSCQNG